MSEFNLKKEFFQLVLSNINEEVYLVNDKYEIIYVNKNAFINLFNGQDVINHSIFETFPSITMENSTIINTFKTGMPIIKSKTTFICNNGKRKVTLTSTLPLKIDDEVKYVCEISEDITGISNISEKYVGDIINDNKINHEKIIKKSKDNYYNLSSIIGVSYVVKNLKEQISIYANSSSNLMIYGETGTGKEMVAQSVFTLSHDTKKDPFIALNCAAIPESLLESILFGTVKGAFTGAETKPGLMELASGGVLFLDEINSMPLVLQSKILRTLQEGKVRRVGGCDEIDVNFRLISSTNVSPEELLSTDNFRKDLFYRLNVLYLEIPPLRERKEDIPALIEYFIFEFNDKLNKKTISFDDESMEFFMENEWPGNVRELKNIIERSINLAKGPTIKFDEIQLPRYCKIGSGKSKINYKNNESITERIKLRETLQEIEIKIIKEAVLKFNGNVSKAARELDIPQQTLNSKIKKYNIM